MYSSRSAKTERSTTSTEPAHVHLGGAFGTSRRTTQLSTCRFIVQRAATYSAPLGVSRSSQRQSAPGNSTFRHIRKIDGRSSRCWHEQCVGDMGFVIGTHQ